VSVSISEPHLSAWRALLDAHVSLIAAVEDELAANVLPPLTWYDVLWAVRSAPGRRIRMAELASRVTISRGGLTKLADRLETAGLIRREAAEEDGRGFYAVLTDAGEDTLRRMWPVYARVIGATFVPALTATDASTIAAGLARAADAARSHHGYAAATSPRRGKSTTPS
jgi:DNA-binding MarR family transcriptional regulator